MTDQKLSDIDTALNVLNPDEIQYIYGGITQQPISRKWQQQAELKQPPEFDFTWEPPTKDSVVTRIVLLNRNLSIDEYKDRVVYIDTYLVKRLYELFGTKCVNRPGELVVLSHMEYGDVFQFYVFYKKTLKEL